LALSQGMDLEKMLIVSAHWIR